VTTAMKLRLGTRRSRLATAQTQEIVRLLASRGIQSEVVPMVTAGDRGVSVEASPQGVKGLFVGDLVEALRQGEIDVAVHSAKDLPAGDEPEVVLAAFPPRESAFDVLVTRGPELASDGRIGTSSVRRRAQVLRTRPEARVVDIRGNVDTRLAKLAAGQVDALVLAAAGLHRLGAQPEHAHTLTADEMVPAPGQGALAVQAREGADDVLSVLGSLDHEETRLVVQAERAVMAALGGGCALPLGAHAVPHIEGIALVAIVASPDGARLARGEAIATTPNEAAGRVVELLRAAGADDILAAAREER
jgi:hydroxymethylbilane synthase